MQRFILSGTFIQRRRYLLLKIMFETKTYEVELAFALNMAFKATIFSGNRPIFLSYHIRLHYGQLCILCRADDIHG